MREIYLNQGQVCLVSDEDYEKVNQFRWRYCQGYALRYDRIAGKTVAISMHRFIMDAQPGEEIDHKESTEKLNNTRSNLRRCTRQQNSRNRKRSGHSRQPYKGIFPASPSTKGVNRWRAKIHLNGRRIRLGYFPTPEAAAAAYNRAARELFGEFAALNDIPGAVE